MIKHAIRHKENGNLLTAAELSEGMLGDGNVGTGTALWDPKEDGGVSDDLINAGSILAELSDYEIVAVEFSIRTLNSIAQLDDAISDAEEDEGDYDDED